MMTALFNRQKHYAYNGCKEDDLKLLNAKGFRDWF